MRNISTFSVHLFIRNIFNSKLDCEICCIRAIANCVSSPNISTQIRSEPKKARGNLQKNKWIFCWIRATLNINWIAFRVCHTWSSIFSSTSHLNTFLRLPTLEQTKIVDIAIFWSEDFCFLFPWNDKHRRTKRNCPFTFVTERQRGWDCSTEASHWNCRSTRKYPSLLVSFCCCLV